MTENHNNFRQQLPNFNNNFHNSVHNYNSYNNFQNSNFTTAYSQFIPQQLNPQQLIPQQFIPQQFIPQQLNPQQLIHNNTLLHQPFPLNFYNHNNCHNKISTHKFNSAALP